MRLRPLVAASLVAVTLSSCGDGSEDGPKTIVQTVTAPRAAGEPADTGTQTGPPRTQDSAAATCSRSAAKRATLQTAFADEIVTLAGSENLFDDFRVSRVLCRDLTGDGRKEMVVLLACCGGNTVLSSPWAIFKADDRGWRLGYSRPTGVVHDLKVSADSDVATKSPKYGPNDAKCCPSAYIYRSVHWNGTAFVTVTHPGPAASRFSRCGHAKPPPGDPPGGLSGYSGVQNVRAKSTSCTQARRIASAFVHRQVERPEGFRCRRTSGEGYSDVRCTLGPRVILFRSVAF